MKALIFEGAGWDKAEHNGVGNCRIRTRFNTPKGQVYFEMTGHQTTKYTPAQLKVYNFVGAISHLFYEKDQRTNHSPELARASDETMEYTKENILKFVNANFGTSFTHLFVNNGSLRVFTEKRKPLQIERFLKISNSDPLSTQLQKLTGDSWGPEFEPVEGDLLTTKLPFVHKKSGRIFYVLPDPEVKTLQAWQDSKQMLSEFLTISDQIDDTLTDYVLSCVPPVTWTSEFIQMGEAYDHNKYGARYLTFFKDGENWQYIGLCNKVKENTKVS